MLILCLITIKLNSLKCIKVKSFILIILGSKFKDSYNNSLLFDISQFDSEGKERGLAQVSL